MHACIHLKQLEELRRRSRREGSGQALEESGYPGCVRIQDRQESSGGPGVVVVEVVVVVAVGAGGGVSGRREDKAGRDQEVSDSTGFQKLFKL